MPLVNDGSAEYEWVQWWALKAGAEPESRAYINAVRDWRLVWRPARVLKLLVAESHVAEHPGDDRVRVAAAPFFAGVPDLFVRLVYCLGYGESWLCGPAPKKNGGTWQFWDIFGAIVGGLENRMPRVRRRADRSRRLSWKLDVLRQLKDRGIWLVDASVLGIYSPGGGRRFAGNMYREMIRDSYARFVWPCVKSEPLKQVWTIGRGVGEALRGLDGIDAARTISQPQDRDRDRYFSDLERMVSGLCA